MWNRPTPAAATSAPARPPASARSSASPSNETKDGATAGPQGAQHAELAPPLVGGHGKQRGRDDRCQDEQQTEHHEHDAQQPADLRAVGGEHLRADDRRDAGDRLADGPSDRLPGSCPGFTLTITEETLSLGMTSGLTAVVCELSAMA